MPDLDRDELIDLLDRLGSPDDAQALNAARLVHRRIREADVRWADLLGGTRNDVTEPEPVAHEASPRRGPVATSDVELIDHMLSAYDLTLHTRQDLEDMKADIAAGEFTERDARYLRDLQARLDRGRRP